MNTFGYLEMTRDVFVAYSHTKTSLDYFVNFHTYLTTIYAWIVVSSANFHRLCVWLMYIFWYVEISNKSYYGRFSDSISFLWEFLYILLCLKLLQIVHDERWKVNLCNNLWLRQYKFQFQPLFNPREINDSKIIIHLKCGKQRDRHI